MSKRRFVRFLRRGSREGALRFLPRTITGGGEGDLDLRPRPNPLIRLPFRERLGCRRRISVARLDGFLDRVILTQNLIKSYLS